jgi:hypothetical protein
MSAVDPRKVLARLDGTGVEPEAEDDGGPRYEKYENVTEGRERKRLDRVSREKRRAEMAAMYADGKYLRTIAKAFNTSVSQVSETIDAYIAEIRSAALKSVGERLAREEAIINMVQLEAIEAWFESKQGKIVNNKKRALEIRGAKLNRRGKKNETLDKPRRVTIAPSDVDVDVFADEDDEFGSEVLAQDSIEKNEEYERVETSPGDPRFLTIILDCSKQRREMYNLNKKGEGGEGLADDEISNMTEGQRLNRLKSLVETARLRKGQQAMLDMGVPTQGQEQLAQSNGNGVGKTDSIAETLAAQAPKPAAPVRRIVVRPVNLRQPE